MSTVSSAPNSLSWWGKDSSSWTWNVARKFLQLHGPVPTHVAFVMDGNRRFAKENKLGTVIRGHEMGFSTLQKVLCWCHDLGIREITVYAFSIENFKRSADEVDGLMELAEKQFATLLEESDKLEEKEVSFRFWGRLELLRPSLRKLLVDAERKTSKYTRHVLNICMPYTAKDEALRAAELLREASTMGLVKPQLIDMPLLRRCMDSRRSKDPDLVIRTSGEHRWSDFLLIQASWSHVYFCDVLWPEFDHRHLFQAIFDYQKNYKKIQGLPHQDVLCNQNLHDLDAFIEDYHITRFNKLLE